MYHCLGGIPLNTIYYASIPCVCFAGFASHLVINGMNEWMKKCLKRVNDFHKGKISSFELVCGIPGFCCLAHVFGNICRTVAWTTPLATQQIKKTSQATMELWKESLMYFVYIRWELNPLNCDNPVRLSTPSDKQMAVQCLHVPLWWCWWWWHCAIVGYGIYLFWGYS